MKWYQLTKEAILSKLQTTDKGIQDIERQQRLESNGFNTIEEKQALKPWQKFFKHFTHLLMIVLLFASILKMITGDYVESAIIFLVVIMKGLVGYWEERRGQDCVYGWKE